VAVVMRIGRPARVIPWRHSNDMDSPCSYGIKDVPD
jgi:hypothetical protein